MAYTNIKKSSDYFNTKLYTGTGSSLAITGVDFQPDWVWIKNRGASGNHVLFDAVRGGDNRIESNTTNAEATSTASITSFDSDGFTLGNGSSRWNANSNTYASWNWLGANGTSANTDGSISSTVSANTTSGFSIVSYTANNTSGATVGHGLGVAPSMVICKNRDSSSTWTTFHASLGATKYIFLNDTAGAGTSSGAWNNTAPSSSVFTLGNAGEQVNGSNQIAYCFADVQGYSKFGSYVGNGNADGTFVYTGFKPAFVMRKYTTGGSAGGEGWEMLDGTRSSFNVADKRLRADNSNAEGTGANYYVDFLSNGFKCRTADNATNNSGATYIYMAFAEQPLVGDNPATAR